jgi:hypothetical protein
MEYEVNTTPPKSKTIDITKLKTIKNYAAMRGFTVPWIYKLGERKEINIIEIDGVKFVKID